jgi:hypothetical protein
MRYSTKQGKRVRYDTAEQPAKLSACTVRCGSYNYYINNYVRRYGMEYLSQDDCVQLTTVMTYNTLYSNDIQHIVQ